MDKLFPGSLVLARDLPPGPYYRLTVSNECHNGFKYKTGRNIDPLPFNPTGMCKAGGLYFCHATRLFLYRDWLTECNDTWIREVDLSEMKDEPVWCMPDKFKAHQLVLKERTKYSYYVDDYMPPAMVREMVMDRHWAIGALRHQTPELCKIAIRHDAELVDCIRYQTPELCMMAVRRDPNALRCVSWENRTVAVCVAAVKAAPYLFNDCVPCNIATEVREKVTQTH